MTDNAPDLWPALNDTFRSPLSILKEQAAMLATKTKGLLRAEVVSSPSADPAKFVHDFIVVAPAINYRYSLFIVVAPILGYPATLVAKFQPVSDADRTTRPRATPLLAKNEAHFKAILKGVLNSIRCKAVLNALLSQSS